MTNKTTATERLRQLLDERGVEWGRLVDSYGIIGTFWWDSNNDQCSALEGADDIPIGKLSVQASLTPEQAVEATLGRGTCHIVKTWSDSDYVDGWRYRCSECMCFIPVNERNPETGDVISAANYCPNCGRRVEE